MEKENKQDSIVSLFESLDIAEETKEQLQESFDKAVIAEATRLAESKEEEYEEYMLEQLKDIKENLENILDSYLDKVVEEFVEENKFAIEESIKSEKYNAVLEGFNSLMITAGVEIAQIAEAKEAKDTSDLVETKQQLEESDKRIDRLMSEVLELKEKNAELLKTGLIKESMEDMTAMQKDKFLKLARVVEFDASNPVEFVEKIDTLVESVKGEKEGASKEVNEGTTLINENKQTADGKYVPKASHLF